MPYWPLVQHLKGRHLIAFPSSRIHFYPFCLWICFSCHFMHLLPQRLVSVIIVPRDDLAFCRSHGIPCS